MTELEPFETVNIKVDPDLVDYFISEFPEDCNNLTEIENGALYRNGDKTKLEETNAVPEDEVFCVSDDELVEISTSTDLRCSACGKFEANEDSLKTHLRSHFEYKHKCPVCGKSFRSKNTLKFHVLLHKGMGRSCRLCLKTFTDLCDLKKHMFIKHSKSYKSRGTFKCQCCGEELAEYKTYRSHYQSHLVDEGKFVCLVCYKVYDERKNLKTHYRVHNVCYLCDHNFECPSSLNDHLTNLHDGAKNLPPVVHDVSEQEDSQEVAENSFETVSVKIEQQFERNEEKSMETTGEIQIKVEDTHLIEREYKDHTRLSNKEMCKFCDLACDDYDSLVQHTREIHYSEEVYFCDVCRKIYKPGDDSCEHIEIYDTNSCVILLSNVNPLMLCLDMVNQSIVNVGNNL